MIVEAAVVLSLLAGGAALLRAAGIRGAPLTWLGFLAGMGLYLASSLLLLNLGWWTGPVIPLVATVVAPIGYLLTRLRRGVDISTPLPAVGLTVVVVLAAVAILRRANLVNYHWDSLEHAALASMLGSGRLDYADTRLLQLRGLGAPLLHAPAHLGGELYLAAITPLLAAAIVLTLGWFVQRSAPLANPRVPRIVVAGAAAAVLVTTNRFVYHAFYLNNHLLVAAAMLLIAGSGWLLSRERDTSSAWARGLICLQLAAIPTLVLARPEGLLIAGIVLLPSLCAATFARGHRLSLAVVWGLSAFLEQLFLLTEGMRVRGEAETNPAVFLVVALVILFGASVVAWDREPRRLRRLPPLAELAVWFGVLGAALAAPDVMARSASATWVNLTRGGGGWGATLVLLAILAVVILVVTRDEHRLHLRFPITTFLPLSLIFTFGRGGAYRVAPADSLSRSMVHVLPLLILLLASAAWARWQLPRATGARRGAAERPVGSVGCR
jgi:hypothetical protein